MSKQKYTKPLAQSLDRTLAVSLGGCATGITPGTCGAPGYDAGTCGSGSSVGVPVFECNAGNRAYPCITGNIATGGCGTFGYHANAPEPG